MRDLVILERRRAAEEEAPSALPGVTPQVDRRPEADPSGASLPLLDLPHRDEEARRRFGTRPPIAIDALAWLAPGADLPAAWSEVYLESFRLAVRAHPGWPAPPDDVADPHDVVKQVSFLHAAAGYAEARFRAHYRRHVEVARRHMPALWQYVQNDVTAAHGDALEARGVVAVSELWFRTTDDFLNRYFPSEADQREFSSHEDFLELSQATSFVCTSHRVDPSGSGG
jgi:hypothetical protein